jgi:uncharacterized protein YbjT (DUF2867 family)
MVGQGVLRECLLAADVSEVVVLGRSKIEPAPPKLCQLVQDDLFDLTRVEPQLRGIDVCFFCLGLSSSGMSEAAYRHINHDLTLADATVLARRIPAMSFIYVSGAGTDRQYQTCRSLIDREGRRDN